MNKKRDEALKLVEKGFFILPVHNIKPAGTCSCDNPNCKSAGKHPRIQKWQQTASNDEAQVLQWWTDYPEANIGIECELSDIMVIDVDNHKSKANGLERFETLIDINEPLPDIPTVITGGNGRHYYFKKPECPVKGKLCEGVDIKIKGYVLAPPSNHVSGCEYIWMEDLSPFDIGPSECPEWLLEMIKSENTGEKNKMTDFKRLPENNKEDFIHSSFASDGELIIKRCKFLEHCVKDADSLSEPEWYHGTIGILCRTVQSSEIIHKYSSSYSNYNRQDTGKKIEHALTAMEGAMTCSGIQEKCGDKYCKDCRFNRYINSPIALGKSLITLEKCNIKDFPLHTLPPSIKEFVVQGSRSLKAPADFIAGSLLVVVSRLIGNSAVIQITPDWTEPAALYCAMVGKPGTKKSPSLNLVRNLLDPIDKELRQMNIEKSNEYSRLKKLYDSSRKTGICSPDEPEKPAMEILYTVNTTVEGLRETININNGMLIISDELTSWIRSLNEYKGGKGSDKSFYLEAWNCKGYKITRSGQDIIDIAKLFCSVIGGIQPDFLREMQGYSGNDGFIDRILFVYPNHNEDGRISHDPIDKNIKEDIKGLFMALFKTCRNKFDNAIKLNTLGVERLSEYHQELTIEADKTEISKFEGYLEKQKAYTARLALILHVIKSINSSFCWDEEVSIETVEQAIELSKYFISHAKRVFGILESTPQEKTLILLQNRLSRHEGIIFKPRDVHQMNMKFCSSSEQSKQYLKLLADYGYGIWIEDRKVFIKFPDVFPEE
jgi:hypothetical protein